MDGGIGPVFMIREGAEVNEGDIGFAASLFPNVDCYFIVDQARDHSTAIQSALAQRKGAQNNVLFFMGVRRNDWLSPKVRFKAKELEIEPLSDGEINRLLDFLGAEDSLDKLAELDREFQFLVVKKKHE